MSELLSGPLELLPLTRARCKNRLRQQAARVKYRRVLVVVQADPSSLLPSSLPLLVVLVIVAQAEAPSLLPVVSISVVVASESCCRDPTELKPPRGGQ